jgi:hypothetical protein
MLRDNLAGLIEPMLSSGQLITSVVIPSETNWGMLHVDRVGDRRS